MSDSIFDRNYLHERHRLSHQQIDRWLKEDSGRENLPEKFRLLQIVSQFISVTDLLRKHDILFVPLKGPLLSHRIYKDAAVRLSHDLDILVDQENLEPVVQILLENGYALVEGAIWPERKIHKEMIIESVHHVELYNKNLNLIVEVHWKFFPGIPLPPQKLHEIIRENLMEVEFAGRTFRVLNEEMELLFLMIHGSKHAWQRLKWLVDIHEYPADYVNAESFYALVRQFDAERIVAQTNLLLKKFYGKCLPFGRKSRLPKFFIRYALQSIEGGISLNLTIKEHIWLYCYNWYLFPGAYYKWKMVADLFVRQGDMELVGYSFKAAYYLYRPYSFIKRRIFHGE